MTAQLRFPSPYDLKSPPGSEGWQDFYPYFTLFLDELKPIDEKRFWFCDAQHWPTPFRPFDTIMVEYACKCLGQYNTRHLMVPPANGIDYRIHNGYRQHLRADRELRSRDPALLQGLATSFRVPQSRLRRLSRFLRLLQGTVSRHPGSGDRAHGAGCRCRPIPARRRTEKAGAPRGRGRR
jgi:hypothetical protein